ncbi:TATA element modulatory factor [Rhopalosiphum maidis]|uniref:TATA element modulatory factor n=1 Tax=Rhopalosiphum maidis TaxID=43146 RepID=UPI000EFE21D2|nr:TATA element modulatory factor [Rhopalosiphum maidis]
MSWFNQFDASGFASLAKTALKEAQKTIDKALDIKDEDESDEVSQDQESETPRETDNQDSQQKISKLGSSLWNSFTNSVFENEDEVVDKQSEMRQSMSLDLSKSSADNDLIVANQPARSTGQSPSTQDEQFNVIEIDSESNIDVVRRTKSTSFNNTNRLSAVSCDSDRKSTISTDSVEILGSTSTTTPESSSIEVITSSSVEVLAVITEPNRANDVQYSPDTIEPIPELIEDDDSLTCSISDNVTCMANEDTLTPHHGGMLLLKSTTSSLDTSFTELSSPHENSGGLDILEEESIEPSSNRNSVILQTDYIETFDNLKNVQNSMNIINTLNTSNSSIDLLKVSDTTLGSSSCDDETMVGSTIDVTSVNEQREPSPQASTDNHSDFVKIGSSETNSCDELETWTSSDIEVISSPATNDDSESNASHRHSPVKYHPDHIPSFLSGQQYGPKDFEDLLKKIVELNSTVKSRESKLIDLSKKNAELAANNSEMKSQLDYLNSSNLNEEYTQRLATMEKKFQQAIREKDQLQKQLDQNKNSAQFKVLIEDKDSLIKELRDEGEKLSKQHLTLNNIIKKLRVAEKESLKTINKYKDQQEKLSQEVERIKKSLAAKEEMERSQIEAIHQLTKSNQHFEKENINLLSQVDNLTSTLISLQKEIQGKETAVLELKKDSNELKLIEKDKQDLEEKLLNKNKHCEEMKIVISNLKSNLCKVEENNYVLMNELKQENLSLIRRLEESERRRENSLQETLKATQPLVKELEEKSALVNTLEHEFEKRELLNLKTIDELQTSLNNAESKIKLIDSKIHESNIFEKKCREQIDSLLQNENDLKVKLENLKEENDALKLNSNNLVKLENELAGSKKLLADATLKINTLENELKFEKDKLNVEIEKRKKLQHNTSHQSSPTTSVGVPSEESSFWPSFADDDRSSVTERACSIYDPMRTSFSNTTTILENLQSQIKLKEGEALQLQWELSRRDHERDQLTTGLAALTAKVEEQSISLVELSDLQKRYDALLQLYGEKLEESEELKLDLQDVKDMYKAQIDELLKRDKTG